jgi:two-component system, NarL family, nitrate/nitrite response regulator NarL
MNTPLDELIRIAIFDNNTLVRAGLRLILDSHPGLKVVGEAGEANEAIEIVTYQKPDIILLKVDPIGTIGLEIIQELLKASSSSRIILLARLDEAPILLRAVQEGVLGIVLKTQSPEILIKAIQKVHAGEAWIERSMIANLLTGLTHSHQVVAQDQETVHIAQLSPRERQVIQLIGQGLKNYQIAENLCLSETTVRHHLTSIYGKLGVSDRLELLIYARRYNLD